MKKERPEFGSVRILVQQLQGNKPEKGKTHTLRYYDTTSKQVAEEIEKHLDSLVK